MSRIPWWDLRAAAAPAGHWIRLAKEGKDVTGTTTASPLCALPFKPYVYQGAGVDTLTAFMDDEPDDVPPLTRRQERMARLAELRLWDGPDAEPPPGYVTAVQAAEQLGVSRRTIERYKADLGLTGRPA